MPARAPASEHRYSACYSRYRDWLDNVGVIAVYEVTLRRDTYERIQLLARAWNVDASAAVDRLLTEFQRGSRVEQPRPRDKGDVRIFTTYEGVRSEATFNRDTRRVRMDTGPLAGQTFRSPSGAAVALVQRLKPDIRPERNGWNFWMIAETGRPLATIR